MIDWPIENYRQTKFSSFCCNGNEEFKLKGFFPMILHVNIEYNYNFSIQNISNINKLY